MSQTLTLNQFKNVKPEDYGDGIRFDGGQQPGSLVSPLAGLQPLADRVLVRRIADAEAVSIIVAPEVAKGPKLKGVVEAVGPGKTDEDFVFHPTVVKPGDVVYFSPTLDEFGYGDVLKDGDLILIQEADILFLVGE